MILISGFWNTKFESSAWSNRRKYQKTEGQFLKGFDSIQNKVACEISKNVSRNIIKCL